MVSLKALDSRLHERHSTKLYPLCEALEIVGITQPTFYRWLKAGKVEDPRVRGERGKTFLSADAILRLREVATRVEFVD